MTDHPYAGPDTLVPGETADDDPVIESEYCEECDEVVEPLFGECPLCGMRLE